MFHIIMCCSAPAKAAQEDKHTITLIAGADSIDTAQQNVVIYSEPSATQTESLIRRNSGTSTSLDGEFSATSSSTLTVQVRVITSSTNTPSPPRTLISSTNTSPPAALNDMSTNTSAPPLQNSFAQTELATELQLHVEDSLTARDKPIYLGDLNPQNRSVSGTMVHTLHFNFTKD